MRGSGQQLLSMPTIGGSLQLQIYHRIRHLILSGGWPAGTRLPSSRSLAQDLNVSRNTALLALDKLLADGWIDTRAGSGTYVTFSAPSDRPPLLASPKVDICSSGSRLPFDVSCGAIDVFPTNEWSKIHSKVWKETGEEALLDSPSLGWPQLRQAVTGYLYATRGLVCSPGQVILLSSERSALDLSLRVLANAGDRAWLGNPGPQFLQSAFQSRQVQPVAIPVDRDGMDVSLAMQRTDQVRFAYLSPVCHFPNCAVFSDDRRSQLIEWAIRNDRLIIEEDRDFNTIMDGRSAGEPIAAAAPNNTVLIHSFNQLMFPGLRLAAMVVPSRLVPKFMAARLDFDAPNMANQIALAKFIESGLLSSHIRQSKLAHQRRREAMLSAINSYLPKWLRADGADRGSNIIAYTKRESAALIKSVAHTAGITCRRIDEFALDDGIHRDALVLGFGSFSVVSIDAAAGSLAEALTRQNGVRVSLHS